MEAQNICQSVIHSDTKKTKLQLLTIIQRFVGLEMIKRFTKLNIRVLITTSEAG